MLKDKLPWLSAIVVIAAFATCIIINERAQVQVNNLTVELSVQKLRTKEAEAEATLAKARSVEEESFKDKFLRKHGELLKMKQQFNQQSRVIHYITEKYKIPKKEAFAIMACTCDQGSPCWFNKPCDNPACLFCTGQLKAAQKQAEPSK